MTEEEPEPDLAMWRDRAITLERHRDHLIEINAGLLADIRALVAEAVRFRD